MQHRPCGSGGAAVPGAGRIPGGAAGRRAVAAAAAVPVLPRPAADAGRRTHPPGRPVLPRPVAPAGHAAGGHRAAGRLSGLAPALRKGAAVVPEKRRPGAAARTRGRPARRRGAGGRRPARRAGARLLAGHAELRRTGGRGQAGRQRARQAAVRPDQPADPPPEPGRGGAAGSDAARRPVLHRRPGRGRCAAAGPAPAPHLHARRPGAGRLRNAALRPDRRGRAGTGAQRHGPGQGELGPAGQCGSRSGAGRRLRQRAGPGGRRMSGPESARAGRAAAPAGRSGRQGGDGRTQRGTGAGDDHRAAVRGTRPAADPSPDGRFRGPRRHHRRAPAGAGIGPGAARAGPVAGRPGAPDAAGRHGGGAGDGNEDRPAPGGKGAR